MVFAALSGMAGCATSDSVRAAQHSFDRALRIEPATAFFGPALARVAGDTAVTPLSAQTRQHYLAIIASLEGLTARGQEDLRREGLMGEAFVLKALANWRLGRLERARAAATQARASGQDALDERERSLFAAMEGVLQIEAASRALQAGASYEVVADLILGPNGAWRLLGAARAEVPRGSPLHATLIETRLAAYKVLKDARERTPLPDASPPGEAWARLRAEAQVELREFAAHPVGDAADHAAEVRRWQLRCGLEAIVL